MKSQVEKLRELTSQVGHEWRCVINCSLFSQRHIVPVIKEHVEQFTRAFTVQEFKEALEFGAEIVSPIYDDFREIQCQSNGFARTVIYHLITSSGSFEQAEIIADEICDSFKISREWVPPVLVAREALVALVRYRACLEELKSFNPFITLSHLTYLTVDKSEQDVAEIPREKISPIVGD